MEPTHPILSKVYLGLDIATTMDDSRADKGHDTAPERKMASAAAAPDDITASPGLQQRLLTKRSLTKVRRFLNGFGITLAISWAAMYCLEAVKEILNDNPIGLSHYSSGLVDWTHRQQEVKQAFVTSWNAYAQHAWGKWR